MIARNETFSDITIHLDGSTFVGCTFEHGKRNQVAHSTPITLKDGRLSG